MNEAIKNIYVSVLKQNEAVWIEKFKKDQNLYLIWKIDMSGTNPNKILLGAICPTTKG